jgi:hypothetical protein
MDLFAIFPFTLTVKSFPFELTVEEVELSGVLNVPNTETSDTVLDKFILWLK